MTRDQLISTLEDIYQTELMSFGTASFDIKDVYDMSLEELEELVSHY